VSLESLLLLSRIPYCYFDDSLYVSKRTGQFDIQLQTVTVNYFEFALHGERKAAICNILQSLYTPLQIYILNPLSQQIPQKRLHLLCQRRVKESTSRSSSSYPL
jgi:hypothetical protein